MYKNKRLFFNVNTLVFDGKNEMVYILLQALGGKNNPQAAEAVKKLENYAELAKAFQQVLAGEPIVRVETQWSARYNAGDKEKPDYRTAKTGQKNFPLLDPKDVTKGYNHKLDIKGHGGYVCAPPSQHFDDDGKPDFVYEWLADLLDPNYGSPTCSMDWLPDPIEQVVVERSQVFRVSQERRTGKLKPLADHIRAKGSGDRNNALFWAAATARDEGHALADALAELGAAGVAAGLLPREVERTIRSAYRTSN